MINFFKTLCCIVIAAVAVCSCSVAKIYNPEKKYAPLQLQQDYSLFRKVLEQVHPGTYWYTPKDSMDRYFQLGSDKLKDSLTETGFRNVLSYVIEKIKCGHTVVKPSKKYAKELRSSSKFFPLVVKAL